jgi:hypothetical protein
MRPTTDEQYIDALIAYRVTSYAEAFENNKALRKVLERPNFGTNRNYQRVINKIADNNTDIKKYLAAHRLTPVDQEGITNKELIILIAGIALVAWAVFKIFFYFILK